MSFAPRQPTRSAEFDGSFGERGVPPAWIAAILIFVVLLAVAFLIAAASVQTL